MFRAYADGSALESVAMKAAMVMPALLLQKPHPRSKANDHTLHLERRLRQWSEEDLGGTQSSTSSLDNSSRVCQTNDGG